MNSFDSGPGSLRAEIAAAQSNDTIEFDPSLNGQTITLTSGQLDIARNLIIQGPGNRLLTVSGDNASRVFDVSGGATVAINGLTVADGLVVSDVGGGIRNEGGSTLSLAEDRISDNTAYGLGGGVRNQIGATLTISDCTFQGNRALGSLTFSYPAGGFQVGDGTAEGGAIYTDGTAVVRESSFTDNQVVGASGGALGGAHGGALGADSNLTVSGCRFTGNVARGADGVAGAPGASGGNGGQAEGGAIDVAVATNVSSVSHSVFTQNLAVGGEGGTGGSGADGGSGGVGAAGAISMADATLTLTDSVFIQNKALGGTGGAGGIGGNGGAGGTGRGGAFVHTVTFGTSTPVSNLENDVMLENQALGGAGGAGGDGGNGGNGGSGQGGAIRALLGTINVNRSGLYGNQAIGGLGGAAGAGGTFSGNGGSGQGGGFLTAFGVTAVLSDSIVWLNLAEGGAGEVGGDGLGGGIFNGGPSPFGTPDLSLVHCLVANNRAQGAHGGGHGIGGGVYNVGVFAFDAATVIDHNQASTSNGDIFP